MKRELLSLCCKPVARWLLGEVHLAAWASYDFLSHNWLWPRSSYKGNCRLVNSRVKWLWIRLSNRDWPWIRRIYELFDHEIKRGFVLSFHMSPLTERYNRFKQEAPWDGGEPWCRLFSIDTPPPQAPEPISSLLHPALSSVGADSWGQHHPGALTGWLPVGFSREGNTAVDPRVGRQRGGLFLCPESLGVALSLLDTTSTAQLSFKSPAVSGL